LSTPPKIRRVTLLNEDFMHGFILYAGNRQAMVVRTDAVVGIWVWFAYKDFRMFYLGHTPSGVSRHMAEEKARAYVKTGEIADVPEQYKVAVRQLPHIDLVVRNRVRSDNVRKS
jgi:hypothetical protein